MMWLTKVADAINKIIVPFSKGLVFIGGLFLAAMMFRLVINDAA